MLPANEMRNAARQTFSVRISRMMNDFGRQSDARHDTCNSILPNDRPRVRTNVQ
jgi:hypothetical protein